MKQIFPIDIVENSIQSYWVKRHTKSKIIYWILVILLVSIIFILPLVYIDVTSQSRGVVRDLNENNILQSAIYAEINRVDIFENKTVILGDTLIWLKTEEIDEQISRLQERIDENNLFIRDINNLLSGGSPQSAKYITEYIEHKAKQSEHKISLKHLETEFNTSKTLYEKGVETKHDYLQTENRYKSSHSQLDLIREQRHNTWQAEKTRLEYAIKDIYSEITQLQKRKTQYAILAPISGNIVQYSGIKAGNFLVAGQTIAQITSSDSLLIECYVSPNDIGYIHVGQDVRFQIDAFNYQQWGLLTGKVNEIISDVVSINDIPYFKVRCSVDRNYLELPNGYIKKGITLTARFFLTERSLAELLFDKIDDWVNPKIINNGN